MKCSDFELFGKIGGGIGTSALEITIDQDRYNNPDERQRFPPGNYDVTITGIAVGSTGPLTATTSFRIKLNDPCDPPQITANKPNDQEYTLTDTAFDYTAPEFNVNPSFCKVDYETTIPPTPGIPDPNDGCVKQEDPNDPLKITIYCRGPLDPANRC